MKHKRKGFTLVEIIMVLGIVALITAAVFIAVSGAQRSGRDTQRRADVQKLATAIEQYAANNNGKLPADENIIKNEVIPKYIGWGKFKDPSTGTAYPIGKVGTVAEAEGSGFWELSNGIWYIYNPSNSPDSYKLVQRLEAGKYIYTP